MVKRQHQQKRHYREDEERTAESARPGVNTEVPNVKREFILTPSADDTLQDVVRLFSRATGASLTKSHFLRALFKTVAHAMPELEREASQVGKLDRPSNARGNEAEREEYEQKLAEAILAAMRSCPPLEWGSGEPRKAKSPGRRSE